MASGIRFKSNFKSEVIERAVKRSSIKTLPRAGAFVRAIAKNSLGRKKNKEDVAPVGKPPNTFGLLRRAIKFEVAIQKDSVVIGPDFAAFSNVGRPHELGGNFRKRKYPKRPFMGPALIKATPKLPKLWAKTIR